VSLEDIQIVVIEAQDRSGHHLHTLVGEALGAFDHIYRHVLTLLGLAQTFLIRCFDPYEDRMQAGPGQELQHFGVITGLNG
jgi:hypothetical protein